MQNQAIQVKGLQKSYKNLHVLKGVDFEVEKGSIFALLGSNGAGKTTAIKILSTLIKPDRGSVQANGFAVARQKNANRLEATAFPPPNTISNPFIPTKI
jgi:ABC-2 type transport system ATP-binding protein